MATEHLNQMVGGDLLDLITTGMYSNPLAMYREYLQNSADAIESRESWPCNEVEIEIDPVKREVAIRDFGPGLSEAQARRCLIPISRSQKRGVRDRGFRGIGRLAGLAFGTSVSFRTRSTTSGVATEVIWDKTALKEAKITRESVASVIGECVELNSVTVDELEGPFFEAKVKGIPLHLGGSILNPELVKRYIAEACPVAFSPEFPYSDEVSSLLGTHTSLTILDVGINGDPVVRRHIDNIAYSPSRVSQFTELEEVQVTSADSDSLAAVGWIAHSRYLGAIPSHLGIRGIRVRVGNLQIGDESVFHSLFSEDRFNYWCVGEIHVLDSRIRPNARRDYFEHGPHLRNLENQLAAVFGRVSERCRRASIVRNWEKKIKADAVWGEDALELAASGYVSATAAKYLVNGAKQRLALVDKLESEGSTINRSIIRQVRSLRRRISNFTVRRGRPPLGKVPASHIPIYRKMFDHIAMVSANPAAARLLIEDILEQENEDEE